MVEAGDGGKPTRRRAGRVELALRRDLAGLGDLRRSALAELALVMARAIDGGQLSNAERVKAASELRVTLAQLREVHRDRGADEGDGDLSTPVWHAADHGASDVGPGGGGGGAAAG